MALSKLPKAFDFPETKGYFPHFFNTVENEGYSGSLPLPEFYGVDSMMPEERTAFLQWYSDQQNQNVVFNLDEDLKTYCVQDVQVLRHACLAFMRLFETETGVNPFLESITIASACNTVFRKNFLKENTISLIPRNGYRWADKQSLEAIRWLVIEERERGIEIQHAGRGREVKVRGNLKVDGYWQNEANGEEHVWEYQGCIFHACKTCYPSGRQEPIANDPDDTLDFRYERTLYKMQRLHQLGYIVHEMWGCEFRNMLKDHPELKRYTDNHPICNKEPLNPRDAFYGGRTNATKLFHEVGESERIQYVDVCSLYPYCCKVKKFPIGHPKIYIGSDCPDIFSFEGLVKAKVLPPQNIYHPVLPYRANGKLLFPLCRTCADEFAQNECTHLTEERAITGTWVVDELRKAVEKGYKILELLEVWAYDMEEYNGATKTGGLFSEYINTFLKLKVEASGWPSWCTDDRKKQQYVEEFYRKEGIRLNPDKIEYNPGRRSLAKLMLNSFWGKFGQCENHGQTTIIQEPQEFFEKLADPNIEVHQIVPINDQFMIVHWEHSDDSTIPLSTVNVTIAAYTTAHARLELYNYLDQLDERVLYFDTDSVIYVQREHDVNLPVGDFLGNLTNELEVYGKEAYIRTFCSGGPKNYAFEVVDPATGKVSRVCKVRGITLNWQNSKTVNFETLRDMVLQTATEDVTPCRIVTQNKILRTKEHKIITKEQQKVYRIVYNKRKRLHPGFDTVPYGYNKQIKN